MPDEPTPTPATPATAPAPPAPASPPPPPATVTIPTDQLTALLALQGKVAQLEADQRTREAAAAEERVKLLTQKGEAEAAVKTLREQKDGELAAERGRLATTEERAKRYALEGELARAIGAHSLVSPAAAAQLAREFRGEFQVHAEGDSFVVRTPTFQSVPDFIRDRLAHADYAHFVRAGTGGGTGGQTTQAAPTQAADKAAPPGPASIGEAMIRDAKDYRKEAGEPSQNMALPFGLKRIG